MPVRPRWRFRMPTIGLLQTFVFLKLAVTIYAQDYGSCDERGSPVHGTVRTIIRRPKGLMVQYHCNNDYRSEGHMYSVCIEGKWNNPLPLCVKKSTGSHVMSDAAKQDKVYVSHEELPLTQQTPIKKKPVKRKKKKRKKKRKRKGKNRKTEDIIILGNSTSVGHDFDMTCLVSIPGEPAKFVRSPRVPSSSGPKFVRRKREKRKYLVAVYHCLPGYKLHNSRIRSLGCREGKWVGQLPICLPKQRKLSCASSGCQHDCKESLGKLKCFCFKGFRQIGSSCVDINECSVQNGGCHGTCHNTPGSYFCGCAPGYRLASDHSSCIDTNECLSRNGHGPCQGQCTNMKGSYVCSCEGMPGTQIADDGISCRDIDECSEQEYLLGCSHACINTLGTAFCICPSGYQLGPDWRTCQDINECTENLSKCTHNCKNTPGSYTCSCPNGFTDSGGECVDVNECTESENGLCSHTCENSIGSYKCTCPADHQLSSDQKTCHFQEADCQMKNCTQGCAVKNEIVNCICDEGFVLENDTICVDIDECQGNLSICSHNCINEEGSFLCTCPKDMVLLPDNVSCDVGQCDWSICPQGCQNEDNSLRCKYNSNQYGEATLEHLEDVRDCDDIEMQFCSQLCKNTNNRPECYCKEGFYLDNDKHTCIDIDECEDLRLCNGSQCVNTDGSYYCKCPKGYKMNENSRECDDIDECEFLIDEGSSICSHICINFLGSFYCSCPFGFVIGNDSRTCDDIDECIQNNDVDVRCSHICVNDIGSYHCECPPGQGYVLDEHGHTCLESLGCHVGNGGCSHICTEDGGETMCDCPEGLILDNDNVSCLQTPCSVENGGCSQLCDDSTGFCFCNDGFNLHQDLKQCLDVNECIENNGNCSQNCVNTEGSYYCTCDFGFQNEYNESRICKDIDECSNNQSLCNQLCVNTNGSYNCKCLEGYLMSSDGVNCEDIDECVDNKCSQNCVNMVGSFRCECDTGFSLSTVNYTCEDIDECSLNISNCSQICKNVHGGYFCECETGFQIVNESQCIETFPISNGNKCDHGDVVKNGTEFCCCRVGYVPVNQTKCILNETCELFDECTLSMNEPSVCTSSSPTTLRPLGDVRKPGCKPISTEDQKLKIDCGSLLDSYPEGTECQIKCKIGYKLQGSSVRICVNNSWSGTDTSCKAEVHPYIRCPSSIKLNLPLGKSEVIVELPRPKTNMDWEKHVSSIPPWGKSLTSSLPTGTTIVQFTVQSPSSSLISKCKVSIQVKDLEKPIISNCPDDISVQVSHDQKSGAVEWVEPIISDNVHVAHIFQSQRSGTEFNRGIHTVNYVAIDSSGNIATCEFKVNIKGDDDKKNIPLL